jgi:catechol 2,3-dioxygenase-like lactoylglutathione lyase family enzyme
MKTGHVGLNVTDLDRSTDFYRRVLALDVVRASEPGDPHRFAMLGRDGELVLTLWQQSTGAFRTDAPGLHHLSFEVADAESVRQAETTLKEIGATFAYEGVVPHREGSASGGIFFHDPDGTRLEIYTSRADFTAPAPSDGATCGFF